MKNVTTYCLVLLGLLCFSVSAQVSKGYNQSNPINTIDVNGSMSIGTTYSGSDTVPSNSLAVQGVVGVGTASPSAPLTVNTETDSLGWLHRSNGFQLNSRLSNQGAFLGTTNHSFHLETNDSTAVWIQNERVGIAIPPVLAKLQVLDLLVGVDVTSERKFHASQGGDNGQLRISGQSPNSALAILFGTLSTGNGSTGGLTIYQGSIGRVQMRSQWQSGDPSLYTFGANNSQNAFLFAPGGLPFYGQAVVYDAFNTDQCGFFISAGLGYVYGDFKTFVTENPDDHETEIWYASREGPEAALYYRGTGRLTNGRGTINLPKHFTNLCGEELITVKTTPLSPFSNGLSVVRKNCNQIEIRELGSGTGGYQFDFMVTAMRKELEDFQVIRPKRQPIVAIPERVNLQ